MTWNDVFLDGQMIDILPELALRFSSIFWIKQSQPGKIEHCFEDTTIILERASHMNRFCNFFLPLALSNNEKLGTQLRRSSDNKQNQE